MILSDLCFRPLAGVNYNLPEDGVHLHGLVSVPLRG